MMNAYYAVDRFRDSSVLDDLLHHFKSSTEQSHAFAMVDLAFDHGGTPLKWASATTNLYGSGPLAQLATVSPALVPLSVHIEDEFVHRVKGLLRHANGRPMLSFLQTSLTAEALSAHWQSYLSAPTEDGQSYLLRWGDTRVLPVLAQSLAAEAWSSVSRPLHRWLFINRRGHLQHLRLPDDRHQTPSLVQDIKLGTEELDCLLKAGEPDAVIQVLHETLPHSLPKFGRAAFYERIVECCRLAANHGICAFPDVVAIAAAESVSGLLADPRLAGVLAAGNWPAGHLADRLVDLMPAEDIA